VETKRIAQVTQIHVKRYPVKFDTDWRLKQSEIFWGERGKVQSTPFSWNFRYGATTLPACLNLRRVSHSPS